MEQPEGFEEGNPDEIACHLKQGIYGLEQSGRIWFKTLCEHLLKTKFKQLEYDPCIFHYKTKDRDLYFAIYVDDLLATGTSDKIINKGIELIQQKFKLVETTGAGKILRWTLSRNNDELKITQEIYAYEILQRFGMENCKPIVKTSNMLR